MKCAKKVLVALAVMGLILSLPLLVVGAETAKDIYYVSEDEAQPGNVNLGVKFWIELKDGNTFQPVLTSHDFRSGDKFIFKVQPNMECYVYIFHEGSSGNRAVLFPTKETGTENLVKANRILTVPTTNYFAMDKTPGKEKLYVVLSLAKIETFESLSTNTINYEGTGFYILTVSETRDLNDLMKTSTKDIVYCDDSDEFSPASYVVNPTTDDSVLVHEVTLKHK